MLYLGILLLIIIFTISGIVWHGITESEKWYKVFKKRGRDD